MRSEFEELNEYAYHSLHEALLDVVIWCLGPYVDDSSEYGFVRICLARATRASVRGCCRVDG